MLESRKHPVEVVLLDPHLRGELGDRDTGLTPHQRESLQRTGATAFATSHFAFGTTHFFPGSFGTAWFFAGPRGTTHFFPAPFRATRSFLAATRDGRDGDRGGLRCSRTDHTRQRLHSSLEPVELVHRGL